MDDKLPKKIGRPAFHLNEEQQETIIEMATQGIQLSDICRRLQINPSVLFRYREKHSDFDMKFARALRHGADVLADSLLGISNKYHDVQVATLESNNIKWILSKRYSRDYGDRIDLNVTQSVDISGALKEAKDRLMLLPRDSDMSLAGNILDIPSTSVSDTAGYLPDAREEVVIEPTQDDDEEIDPLS